MITTTKLDPIETASRDELQALQTQRLKWTLKHAYDNVPMYRRKFDAAGVHPDDFRELNDLQKFPCTTKQDLRDNYPFDTFAVPMEQVVRIHASSGTTGKPTVVGYTQNDIDNWANIVARSLRAAGGTAKDKIHVAYGYGLFTGGLGAHYGGGAFRGDGDPDVRRTDRKTGAADPRFSAGYDHGDAVLLSESD
ncbi:phenylacetate-coenzyme A ligase PaaK-like adenylate-forming protein [Klebsiella variicola]|nr:phenylacetate-coenzyme A ligase PaaK-like adenylate-forming protein [Klebsiella variicola]